MLTSELPQTFQYAMSLT